MTTPAHDQITARIAEVLGVAPSRVRLEVVLSELVSDSYRLVEMAIELQDDYDVTFSQTDLSSVTTVGDLADLIRTRAR